MQDFSHNMKCNEGVKMKIKNVIKACVFVCIIVVLVSFTNTALANEDRKPQFLVPAAPANRVINERENSIDVIFVGDSLVQAAFSPYELWENYGFTSFVCGSSGQYMYECYDYLNKVFERQSPSVVVLEVDELHRYSTIEQYTLLRLADQFSIINNHDRWKEKLNRLDPGTKINCYDYSYQEIQDNLKGYVYQRDIVPAKGYEDYMNNSNIYRQICTTNKVILHQINELCKKNNASLVLVSVPSVLNCNNGRRAALLDVAEDMEVDFIDYNVGELKEELALDWSVDTRDAGDHLSHPGMIKICRLFGAYLSEKYDLPDRRNDEEYRDWNEGLAVYHSIVG